MKQIVEEVNNTYVIEYHIANHIFKITLISFDTDQYLFNYYINDSKEIHQCKYESLGLIEDYFEEFASYLAILA